MNASRQNDKRILDILDQDPKEGMTLIVKHYTGLIWKVSSLHLSDPEDIKECTNDTFAEFYFQKDRFDPERASLAVYLTAIARNLSISRYRKERIRQTNPLSEDYPVTDYKLDLAEARTDLKQALASLNPDELRIIQMKYYDGMSVQEIAESLNLPYETVKKRHQRSIVKLRHALLIMLLILTFALITACSYKLLVYYEVIPDVWHNWWLQLSGDKADNDTDTNALPGTKPITIQFPEGQAATETSDENQENISTVSITSLSSITEENITDAPAFSYLAGYGVNWKPDIPFYILKETPVTENDIVSFQLVNAFYMNHSVQLKIICTAKKMSFFEMPIDMVNWGDFHLNCEGSTWAFSENRQYSPDAYTNEITVTYDHVDLPVKENETVTLTLNVWNDPGSAPLTFTFPLSPAETDSVENYACQMKKYGGILAIPRLEDGSLIVEIYPINTDEDYSTLPGLIRKQFGESDGTVLTATDSDGNTLTGTCIRYNPSLTIRYFKWDFGPASPGTYTLHIPYLYQIANFPENFLIPITLSNFTGDQDVYDVPGGSIWVEGCTEGWTDGALKSWNIRLRYNSTDKDHAIMFFSLNDECPDRYNYPGNTNDPNIYGFTTLESNASAGTLDGEAVVNTNWGDNISLYLFPQSENNNIVYRWNQSFDLTFTVK